MNDQTPFSIDFDTVADLYDIYVKTDFDIPFWLDRAKSVSGNVLELACGTGRVSVPLLEAGVKLSCVDYAPGMLARFAMKLKEKQLSCPVYCQDMAHLDLPERFDLIFIPFHAFSEIIDKQRQRLALKQIRMHLNRQGLFICTLQNPVLRRASMDGEPHHLGDFPMPGGGTLTVSTRTSFDPLTRIASGEQVYEQFSPGKICLDRRTLGVSFYLFERTEFQQVLTEIGFSVAALYGDYDGSPFEGATSPYMIWALH